MTRMKKMTMKKSSLRGSDPAWVHKADFYGQGEQIRSHSSSSGGLIGPWRLCQETVKAERPWLAAYHPPILCSSFLQRQGRRASLETTCYSFSTLYRPSITICPESFAISPPPQTCSAFLGNCFVTTTIYLCWPIRVPAENNSGSRRFSVAIATGVRKLCVTATLQEPSHLRLYSPSISILLGPERMSSRDGGKPSTSQCTNCWAGQSG